MVTITNLLLKIVIVCIEQGLFHQLIVYQMNIGQVVNVD